MKILKKRNYILFLICFLPFNTVFSQKNTVLNNEKLAKYVQQFNALDSEEAVVNYVANKESLHWLSENIPLFECPDSTIQTVYYYRWWALRKHLKQTSDGFIFTEFITNVKHAGKHNAISSALGHHIYETRWLHNQQYADDYINFWLHIDPKHSVQRFHAFSSWIDDAVYNRYLVNLDKSFLEKNLITLSNDYKLWETERQLSNGMFYQFDVKDAMEESISGGRKAKNIRPTINSYMYGNALALTKMAAILHNDSLQNKYRQKADFLKKAVLDSLWDENNSFFKVRLEKESKLCDAREELGFIPWYFNLPNDQKNYANQWSQLLDTTGFKAKWGITTAERRHSLFRTHGSGHGCEWDGAVWPFATTQTIKGLSNLLTNYKHHGRITKQVFYDELQKYANSHQMNGKLYLGEYQDEKNGEWLKGDNPRSKFYNHSSFADLVINDLVGFKPREDNIVEINPIITAQQWDWFCLDKVQYHGKNFTILWDKTGEKYRKGKGFRVFIEGIEINHTRKLKKILVKI
ncbi:glycosyl hydrolase family 65 protein [Arcicella sp. LKC2W]|uniref:MGH1-like glycoside hydrolase domain-containing protein n=1 Tax=Arcicella sp. LKC2W TaxID=2984198 RepID=UPI002B1F040F|nr:glycosyl hydrolase family 65 protein [Arcicella sp. LKC2W]MEA5460406.1 glycosyl hydrolase family 65 protein [Arcicella sp. LKC2W]